MSGSTFLSGVLSPLPVLGYLALEIFDDYALIIMLVLTVLYLYWILKVKNPVFFVPVLWFVSLMIAAPNDTSAWRFSYEAIVPLTLMAGFGLYSVLPDTINQNKARSSMAKRTRMGQSGSILPRGFVFVVLLGGIIIGSWGTSVVADSVSNTGIVSQSQQSVYNAIYWLGSNTPNNSQYLSVSDWRFTYTNLILGRITFYQYAAEPSQAIKLAKNGSTDYVIVTNITTLSLPAVPSLFPWNNFPSSSNSNLTLIYHDSDVRIFEIANLT